MRPSKWLLPKAWWKLSALWLLNLQSRTPRAKQALVGHSVKIALLGLAGGLAALSLTLSIVSGFELKLAEFVAQNGGHVLHQNSWLFYDEIKKRVLQAPEGPEEVEIFWASPALLVTKQGGRGVKLESARRWSLSEFKEVDLMTTSSHDSQIPQIEVGAALAHSLKIKVGDKVRLLMPSILKGALEVEVHSLREIGVYDLESRWVRVDESILRQKIQENDAEAFENRIGDAHGIRYFFPPHFHDPNQINDLNHWKQEYENRLLNEQVEETPLIRTWAEQRKNLFGSIGLDKMVLAVVLGLLCLVASLNVAAALVVLFLERDREIAVLRAMGLSKRQLLVWILIQGSLMGIAASTVGLFLAQIMGWVLQHLPIAQIPSEVYNLKTLPLSFVMTEQILVFVFGIFASCLLSLLMGLSLIHTNFLDTLRHRS